jgi:hypothetical protein
VLRLGARAPVARLPLFGLGFGSPLGATTTAPPAPAVVAPGGVPEPTTTTPQLDREDLNRTKRLDGEATVHILGAETSPWPAVALALLAAGVIVFTIVAVSRRRPARDGLGHAPGA